ncbi:MAG TPA: metallopeptidase family protein [Polyangiales bacterium]
MKPNDADRAMLEFFGRFELALQDEDLDEARACYEQLRSQAGDEHPEVAYALARLTWATDDDEAAEPLLERVLVLEPRHAEACYDLGCIADDRGDAAVAVERFLRVRALDAEGDRELGVGSPEQLDHIERVARELLDALPAPFGERLAQVPVLIERRPSRTLVAEGFDPRAFGLFEGPTDAMPDVPMPKHIVLYACNLLAEFPEEPLLSEQIEVTLLHEIGHYFGLDEDDMVRLGLD